MQGGSVVPPALPSPPLPFPPLPSPHPSPGDDATLLAYLLNGERFCEIEFAHLWKIRKDNSSLGARVVELPTLCVCVCMCVCVCVCVCVCKLLLQEYSPLSSGLI